MIYWSWNLVPLATFGGILGKRGTDETLRAKLYAFIP